MAEPDYVDKLIAALHHPEPKTPVRAAWILGEKREKRALSALARVLRESGDAYLSEAAALALGKIGGSEAVVALTQALASHHFIVRAAAAEWLGEIGGEEALAGLHVASNDATKLVREKALAAIVKIERRILRS